MSDAVKAAYWPAFKAAGFLRPALVKQSGKPAVTVDVKYTQPSARRFDGSVGSQEHSMKYQRDDLPYLREGDPVSFLDADGVVIRAERFKVREAWFVGEFPGDDTSGFWRRALLTQIV